MSILRLTFDIELPEGRIDQAKRIVQCEEAMTAFRAALGEHKYHDAVMNLRGPKTPKAEASEAPASSEEHPSTRRSRAAA